MLIQQEKAFDIEAQLLMICLKETDVGGGERSEGFNRRPAVLFLWLVAVFHHPLVCLNCDGHWHWESHLFSSSVILTYNGAVSTNWNHCAHAFILSSVEWSSCYSLQAQQASSNRPATGLHLIYSVLSECVCVPQVHIEFWVTVLKVKILKILRSDFLYFQV